MRLMRSLGALLIWTLGVVLVATVAWVAINSAGRQVVDGADTVVAGTWDDGAGMDPGAEGTSPPASPSPSSPPASPPRTSSPAGPTGSPSTGGGTPGAGHSDTPSGGASAPASAPPSAPSARPTPAPVSATQPTMGGSVWVECTGTVVTNSLALPADGWSARRAQRTPSLLEVEFTRSSTKVEVHGDCSSGRPTFRVKIEKDEHDDDD